MRIHKFITSISIGTTLIGFRTSKQYKNRKDWDMLRTQASWYELGGNSSGYSCHLENKVVTQKSIQELLVNDIAQI